MEQKYIVAIEIGSSKIKGALGSIDENNTLSVLAVEEIKDVDSVRYGCIQNVDKVCNNVAHIIEMLEASSRISNRKVKGVYISVGGRSLASMPISETITLPEETEITELIIEQIKAKVKTTNVVDRDIIDVLPCKYLVDKQVVANPVGVFGQSLTAKMNIISCKPQIKRNINRMLCERLQLAINGYVVRPVAIADIVLTDNEKRLGCMFVDFGAETTTVSIYKDAALQYLVTLPLGSRNITRDITTINCIEEKAEEIKKSHGCAVAEQATKKTSVDGLDTIEINNYVQARAAEIVANIVEQINYAGYKSSELPQGIVIVGGGAKLKGFNQLLGTNSGMEVRSGLPVGMIRIVDPRIQTNESVDVLALLMVAARTSVVECLEKFVPEEVEIPVNEEVVEEPEPEVKPVSTKSSKGFSAIIDKVKEAAIKLVTDSSNEDDDDGFGDDEDE